MSKFLIIRFSSIGDIVLTSPVVRCLKKQLPDAEIHFLTKPAFSDVVAHNPYIDKIHFLDRPLLHKAIVLKEEGFDFIIDLHNNLRTQIIKSIIDAPAFSFDKLNIEKWQMVNLKINTLPNIHLVDRYMATLKPFGIENDNEGLDYFFPEQTLPELPENFIVFAIGAQHFTKRLPNDKIISFCKQSDKPVVLLGGKTDEANGNIISQNSNAINLCGKLSLHQSAAVIAKAEKVITHDTGLMHIAAALKKDIVTIWGNTIPEFGMSAYSEKFEFRILNFEIKDLSCRPCSKIGFNACPLGHFNCMVKQEIKMPL